MIFKQNKQPQDNSDNIKLIELMQSAIEGNYTFCNDADFNDKTLAKAYNDFLTKFIEADNQTAIALNQSMDIIGNCNNMRSMLNIVNKQKEALNSVASASDDLSASIKESEAIINSINQQATEAYESSITSKDVMSQTITAVSQSFSSIIKADEAMRGFSEKSEAVNEVIQVIDKIANRTQILALNARVEAARSSNGQGFAVVADEIGKLSIDTKNSVIKIDAFMKDLLSDIHILVTQLDELKEVLETCSSSATQTEQSVQNVSMSMKDVISEINELYNRINIQNSTTTSFAQHTLEIAQESDMLEDYCKKPGKDMYIISRAIDKIRTSLVKKRSRLSTTEMIDIYITDHLIFTGRLYNMIEDFEELLLRNLNQPDNCKYGKWSINVQNQYPQLAREFAKADKLHCQLHEFATSCFKANEAGNKQLALEYFDKAQEVYKPFATELSRLKDICVSHGI